MEFLRPFVMPVILVLMLIILWVLGSMKAMDAQIQKCSQPTIRSMFVAQTSVDDAN